MPQPDATDSPDKQLAARDELLQVMYWLRGEGLAKDVAESKLVEATASGELSGPRFRLTEAGVKEGGRRFADEFAELTKPGHYECGDLNCECRRTGNPADCV